MNLSDSDWDKALFRLFVECAFCHGCGNLSKCSLNWASKDFYSVHSYISSEYRGNEPSNYFGSRLNSFYLGVIAYEDSE